MPSKIGVYTALGAVVAGTAAIAFVVVSSVYNNMPIRTTAPQGFPAATAATIVVVVAAAGGTLGGGLALAENRELIRLRNSNDEAKGARRWLISFVVAILALTTGAWATGVHIGQRVLNENRISTVAIMLITRSPHEVSVVRATPIAAPGQEPTRTSLHCGIGKNEQGQRDQQIQVLPAQGWLLGMDGGIAVLYVHSKVVGKTAQFENCIVHVPLSAVIMTDTAEPGGRHPNGP